MQKPLTLRQKILKGLIEERRRLKRKLMMSSGAHNEVDRTVDEIRYQEIGRKIQEFRYS